MGKGFQMAFSIRWLCTACFEIHLDNQKKIVIDPYLDDCANAPISSDQIEGCDCIFLTHGHYDHVLDVGKLVERFQSHVYCSQEVAEALIEHQGIDPDRFFPITAGDTVEEEGLQVEVLHGVHVDFVAEYQRLTGKDILSDTGGDFGKMLKMGSEALLGTITPPEHLEEWMLKYPAGEQLNFVFDAGEDKRIYMAGSYPDPSLMEVARDTRSFMTLLQVIPGRTLQGLEERVVEFGLASGARIIVPQHHDPLMVGAEPTDLSKLRSLFEGYDVEFQEFVPGHWYSYP
jgi:L-ascorbate metabolism protein UlaG (beta-lactamase superfamily)